MGIYLNSKKPFSLYESEKKQPYFVDKTQMLQEIIPLAETGNSFICITRPRRFGKTVMANMISSFFGKGMDAEGLFEGLYISRLENAREHLNRYHVISISWNETPRKCSSYIQYIERIENRLVKDLKSAFPDMDADINTEEMPVWDVLEEIYEKYEEKFIFVFDEWDYIFHQNFVHEADKKSYLVFLSSLLKDKPYVLFVYMTGILPIAKYSSGSELNMFLEYTMAAKEKYCRYFGFSDAETDELYLRYREFTKDAKISREDLRTWYDGYQTAAGIKMYNPRSVVCALRDNQLSNYWTSSGPYDEIFYYIQKNIAEVCDGLALMVSGIPVSARVEEYAAAAMHLQTKDEIFSAMVVYGFLTYENGKVFIPNKELMDRFTDMLRKEPSLGYIYRLARKSECMLQATLRGDTEVMTEILEYAHHTETPMLHYNNETELAAIVNLVYLSAGDSYRVEREDKAGTGYVDFIFYPEIDPSADGIILELKIDHTPEDAVRQIHERKYALRFYGKTGELPKYTGQILAVGIAYDRKTKKHSCKVEYLKRLDNT